MNINPQDLVDNMQKLTTELSKTGPTPATSSAEGVGSSSSVFMGLTMSAIVISFLFSMIGLGYFRYGKKNQSFLFMMSGILLMVFPYIVHDTIYILLTGAAICSVPFLLKRFF